LAALHDVQRVSCGNIVDRFKRGFLVARFPAAGTADYGFLDLKGEGCIVRGARERRGTCGRRSRGPSAGGWSRRRRGL
jgi:hypothetical protein